MRWRTSPSKAEQAGGLMLHAIAKGKSTLYRRYLGERDGNERKICEEDEITSTVLGPLDFLPAADVQRFWQLVLRSAGQAKFLPEHSATRVLLETWPRRRVSKDGRSVEPDAVVTMTWANGVSRTLLIELKWRAPLSGENQLHRQWQHYLTEAEQESALHLFIAPEVSAGAQAPNEAGGDVWHTPEGSRLVLLPWLKIRAVLGSLSKDESALGRWAKLTDQFLERVRISSYGGFNQLSTAISLPDLIPTALFWRPYKFTGWGASCEPLVLPNTPAGPIFFSQSRVVEP
jgi:hypothetical protein